MSRNRPKGDPKDAAINFRTTSELRDRITLAASAANRSLAQEVELRLDRSFDDATLLRTIIREEIRAALADMTTVYAYRDIGFRSLAQSQIHDRSALNGKQ